MSIKVLKPGLATSVQDAGREGHYHLGIPPSGALDQYALRAANLLVGNAPTAAVLECALLGPQLEFQRDALVAVCGARMTPRLEGAEMPLDSRELDRRLGGGPHRLPLQGRHGAPVRAARTAIRRRLGPVQHRRRLLSHRLDPGTGRARTHRPAS